MPSPLAEPAASAPDPGQGLACACELIWRAPYPLDVRAVLSVHRRGYGDPAFATDRAGAIWRACRTPEGPGTVRVSWRPEPAGAGDLPSAAPPGPGVAASRTAARPGTAVHALAWGAGAGWLLAALPELLGSADAGADFAPVHPVLARTARRHPGWRIGRTGLVLESLVPAVLEQKVVGKEATRAWRILLRRFGEPAPGPVPDGMRVPPGPQTWAAVPSWEWHAAGVEAVRARTIMTAARFGHRLEEIAALPPDAADRRLQALPGVGPWTSAEVRQRACGDADAVSVGDYHLPTQVGCALAGYPVDDAGMLELLEPYRGHRHRAAMLAVLSGTGQARRGPRLPARDYRAF